MDCAHRAGIDEQRVVRMAVDVDEARRDGEAGRVDLQRVGVDPADAGDAAVLDRDVRDAPLCAGAVVHGPVPEDELHARFPP